MNLRKGIILLMLIGTSGTYAQYNTKKIDSMVSATVFEPNLEKSLKKIDHIYRISKKEKYEKGIVKSMLLRALKYNWARQYEKAFRATIAAESAVIKFNDPEYLTIFTNLKGMCYTNLGFFEEAEKTYLSSISFTERIVDSNMRHKQLGDIYIGLGFNISSNNGSLKKQLWYYKKSEKEFKKLKGEEASFIVQVQHTLGSTFLKLKQYDSAHIYFKKAIINSEKYNYSILLPMVYNEFGRLCLLEKKYHLAIIYYEKGLKFSKLEKNSIDENGSLEGLSKAYTALGKTEKAMVYLQRSATLRDSLAVADKKAIKTPLRYILKNKEQQHVNDRKKYLNFIVIICFLLFLVLFSFFYYKRKVGIKLQGEDAKIKELIAKLSKDNDNRFGLKTQEFKEVIELAVTNSPVFLLKFNELEPGFIKELQNIAPSLIATEIEFCALLRLNFETKEIARYTNSSVRAVEGKKYRVRKKLQISSQQDIYLWMSELEYEKK